MRSPAIILPCILLLEGCAFIGQNAGNPSEAAATTPPALWNKASKGQHGKISTGWLTEFRDPRMKALVQEAIDKNNNLQAAAYRLRATRENNITSRAARLPRLGTGGSASRSHSGLGSSPGISTRSYGLSFSASWEI
ncbi:MAG: TolC family protein, partial [Verrucomicrobiota bacterium]|nr:TolC family protein [Verrucomicrobiota bacterium]